VAGGDRRGKQSYYPMSPIMAVATSLWLISGKGCSGSTTASNLPAAGRSLPNVSPVQYRHYQSKSRMTGKLFITPHYFKMHLHLQGESLQRLPHIQVEQVSDTKRKG